MRNVRIRLSYDGSHFFGWQRQDGFSTVQAALEEGLQALVGGAITVHGSGRTDTGVHALAQVASFHIESELSDERLLHAINAHTPAEVVVDRLETCPDSFHALRSARGKRYIYRVSTARFRPPFGRDHVHWVRGPLDLERMQQASAILAGKHDFTSFANTGSPRRSNVRNLSSLHVLPRREGLLFALQSNGFLYNMVRILVGTLMDVGRGRLEVSDVGRILAGRDRDLAGPTAPAAGLCLVRVIYAETCFGRSGRPERPGSGA